jgi:hypothetical protein
MIWRRTASNHAAAIGGFARQWLGGTMFDRLIPVTFLGWLWCCFWGVLGLASGDMTIFAVCIFLICPIPWVLWVIDAWLDGNQVREDVAAFGREGAILATRCEYLGGHPQLPHGRFGYLLLEGTRQNPNLTLVFPTPVDPTSAPSPDAPGVPGERFALPILDLTKAKPEKGSDASIAADVATAINKDVGRFLRPERLTLVVDYDGAGGRKHKVEFSNFFHGNNEIRNWQNYLVCAQAQADTGVEPHQPWVALPDDPNALNDILANTRGLEAGDAISRNGHEVGQGSSAFVRR